MTRRILGRSDFFACGGGPFLLGVLRKLGGWMWFSDGEIVVGCGVNVVCWWRYFFCRKMRHEIELIFIGAGFLGAVWVQMLLSSRPEVWDLVESQLLLSVCRLAWERGSRGARITHPSR